jgi:hypothetical protein
MKDHPFWSEDNINTEASVLGLRVQPARWAFAPEALPCRPATAVLEHTYTKHASLQVVPQAVSKFQVA